MASRIRVDVNGAVLTWARETRRLDLGGAAHKLRISTERLKKWENEDEKPTPSQVRKMAKEYVRPICVFFLPARPTDDEPGLKDFRRMYEAEVAVDLSPELYVEIRLAHERRAEAADLAREAGVELPMFSLTASLDDDPEEMADRFRRALGVTLKEQHRWQNQFEAFATWRSAVERLGVLVFQTGRSSRQFVEKGEARGFSISEGALPVVVANGKDAVTARCFTLIHELTHLALRNAGVCDLHDRRGRWQSEFDRVEVFCNHVAAATLVPLSAISAIPEVRSHRRGDDWSDAELSRIARRFWVSWEACLRRLVTADLASNEFYSKWRRSNTDDRYPDRTADSAEIKLPMHVRVIRRNGRLFPRIVFDALRAKRISYRRASSYLGAGAQHLRRIESAVFDPRYAR